jgi:hypothetical protein
MLVESIFGIEDVFEVIFVWKNKVYLNNCEETKQVQEEE